MINYKNIIITVIILIFNVKFSFVNINNPDHNQGCYFSSISDINEIKIGMNKTQVIEIVGVPPLKDKFNSNKWYYIYNNKKNRKNLINQYKTYMILFDQNNKVINISDVNYQFK